MSSQLLGELVQEMVEFVSGLWKGCVDGGGTVIGIDGWCDLLCSLLGAL